MDNQEKPTPSIDDKQAQRLALIRRIRKDSSSITSSEEPSAKPIPGLLIAAGKKAFNQ